MRWGYVQICAAGVLWGTGGLASELIRERSDLSVVTISAYRMGLAALVLVAACVGVRVVAELRELVRERPGRVAAVGASTAAYQTLYFASVSEVGVAVATVIALGLAPALLTAIEAFREGRAPGSQKTAALVAALAGLVLVSLAPSTHGGSGGGDATLGVLLGIASGATFAMATDLGRGLVDGRSPVALTTATTSVGAIVLVPMSLVSVSGFSQGSIAVTGAETALLLLYLGVFTMAVAYGLFYAGLRTTEGSAAVIATLLEPVTAGVAAWFVLGERLGPLGFAGSLLILLAIVGSSRRGRTTEVVV